VKQWLLQSLAIACLLLVAIDASSQTTAFTYQGRLTENANPANGAYQMQFKLFDALSGGSQIGATADNVPVTVAQGIFTTLLDFGAEPLTGANRWLEIGVRHNSGESYTTITPRELISSAPYAVRTLSAAMADDSQRLGGLSAGQFLTVGTAIRNSTLQQSSPANFNISDNGIIGGRLGVGTNQSPSTRLEVVDPVRQMRFGPTISDNGGYLVSSNPSQAIVSGGAKWDGSTWTAQDTKTSLGAFQSGEIGFFADSNLVLGQGFVPTERMKIDAVGNVRQARATGGLAKAMLYVDQGGGILRCYNGMTGISGGPGANCGFSVDHFAKGGYGIEFGFQISDRFYAITPAGLNVTPFLKSTLFYSNGSTNLTVYTFDINTQVANGFDDLAFMIVVY
jgi:hypothetical protein